MGAISRLFSKTQNTHLVSRPARHWTFLLFIVLCLVAAPHHCLAIDWDGSSSTNWFTAANWSSNSVPTSSTDVKIPNGCPNYPVLNANGAVCLKLEVDDSATLNLSGFVIEIYGDLKVNSTSAVSASSTGVLKFVGSSNKKIDQAFTFSGDIECAKNSGVGLDILKDMSFNDLIVSSGVCDLAETQTVSGNVTISSGATLDRKNATLNITGSLTNAGTFDDSDGTGATTLAGNWTDTGTFTTGTRTVTFNGSGTSTITTPNSSDFYDLQVSKTGGAKVVTASNVDVDDDINVASGGELEIGNGYELICGDALSVSGTLDVRPGATLKLSTSLTVNSGGAFQAVSSYSSDLCVITSSNTATPTRYSFSIAAGATISASSAYFRYMNSSGIQITDNASVTAINQLEYCFFDNGASGGKLLRIVNNDNARTLHALQFFDTSSNLNYNVETSGSTAAITIATYDDGSDSTSFGGAANENDNGSGTVNPGFIIWGALTPVRLVDARAEWAPDGVEISWETSTERDVIGFRLERSVDGGPFTSIGPALIPAAGQSPDGASYKEFDALRTVSTRVCYQLVEVPCRGPAGAIARFEVGAGGNNAKPLAPKPVTHSSARSAATSPPAPSYANPTNTLVVVAPAGRVVRVFGSELVAAGFPTGIRSDAIQLQRQGDAWPIEVDDGSDGIIDFRDSLIWVSPEGELDRWNNDEVFILELVSSGGPPARMEVTSTGAPSPLSAPSRVQAIWQRSNASIYAPVLSSASDRPDTWFDSALLAPAVLQIPIELPDAVPEPAELRIVLELMSETLLEPVDHLFRISLDSSLLTIVEFDGRGPREICLTLPPGLLSAGTHQLGIEALAAGVSSYAFLDSVTLHYTSAAVARADRMRFTAWRRGEHSLAGFASTNLRCYQVDGPRAPRRIEGGVVYAQGVTTSLGIVIDTEEGVYEALGPTGFASASTIRPKSPNPPPTAGSDFLLIGPADWEIPVAPLIQRRLAEGWQPQYIAIESIIDHYGHGRRGPEAIRRYLCESLSSYPPRTHVLLIGDATFDPRGFLAGTPPDVVPSSFVRSRDFESVSDAPIADPDDDGDLDFAVGRWPATTSQQVIDLVAKATASSGSMIAPRTRALLVADHTSDGFAVGFVQLAPYLPATETVLLDHAIWPDVSSFREAIFDKWSASTKIVVYAGHGSRRQWSDSTLLHADDAASLGIGAPVPLVIALNCLNGYFAHPASPSLAEALVLAADAGAVGFLAPTGFSSHLENMRVAEIALATLKREPVTVGEAMLRAFDATSAPVAPRAAAEAWILIGDPSLRLP